MKTILSSNVVHLENDVNTLGEEYGLWLDEVFPPLTDAELDEMEREYVRKRAYKLEQA